MKVIKFIKDIKDGTYSKVLIKFTLTYLNTERTKTGWIAFTIFRENPESQRHTTSYTI
jgi:hypothetical protein